MAFRKKWTCSRLKIIAAMIAVLALWTTVALGGDGDLRFAAYYGDLADVKRLLAAGAMVNAKHKNGGTPLMAAALEGHREVMRCSSPGEPRSMPGPGTAKPP
jgi:hypothetical protein